MSAAKSNTLRRFVLPAGWRELRGDEKGYKAFAKVLNKIEKAGCMSWYGDVTTVDGKEQCGLVITCKPNNTAHGGDGRSLP